ncbi:MAG: HAD-IIA family hydrolase [Christensenellaceae bacterium]
MRFMNSPEALERLQKVHCFVLDMDGTFYLDTQIIPGSLEFYHAMLASGRQILFLTNNSSHDATHYVNRLQGMGVPVKPEQIYTSGMATCQYLNRIYPKARVFLMGNHFLREEFQRYGICLVEDNPDLVVAGFDTELTYDKLVKTCDYIRAGLPYIATHPDYNCPTSTGFIPDLGAMMALIEASTGRRADTIVGKPHEEIVRGMLEMTGLEPSALCICGDRLYTDVATGVNAGILSVCVLTGESTEADIASSPVKPDLVVERLHSLTTMMGLAE